MDDIAVRPRYSRHYVPGKRKRRNLRGEDPLIEKVMKQAVICLLILVVIGMIKSVNTPVTGYLTEKIKWLLFQDIKPQTVYADLSGLIKGWTKGGDNDIDMQDADTVPASANLSGFNGDDDKDITYDSYSQDELPEIAVDSSKEVVSDIKSKYSFLEPVDGLLTVSFGKILNPVKQTDEFHTGIDIEAENGAPVRAALDGRVAFVGSSPSYGRYVKIEHGDGIVTLYAHCLNVTVKKGQEVNSGDIIGEIGSSGASVGSHLHFEVIGNDKYLNPLDFIRVPIE